MLPYPEERYKLEKKRLQQFWNDAQRDRWVKEATAQRPPVPPARRRLVGVEPQRTRHLLSSVGALPRALVRWLKAPGKAPRAAAARRTHSLVDTSANGCQGAAVSALSHSCVPPGGTRHPPHATRAAHSRSHSHGPSGKVA